MKTQVAVLCLIIATGLLAIDEPRLPELPGDPDSSRDVRGEKASPDQTEYAITVRFCDGRELNGKWKNKSPEFTFAHTKNRIQYSKTLKVEDLATITIQSWKATAMREKNDGTPYQLLPEEVKITTKDGDDFVKISLKGTEFMELSIANKNGSTRLFTWWMDLLGKDGKWHSSLPAVKGDLRTDCHPDVVRQIIFSRSQNPE